MADALYRYIGSGDYALAGFDIEHVKRLFIQYGQIPDADEATLAPFRAAFEMPKPVESMFVWQSCARGVKGEFADVPGAGRFSVIKVRNRQKLTQWTAHFTGNGDAYSRRGLASLEDGKMVCTTWLKGMLP